MPVAASMAAWARLASTSSAARRLSKSIDALIASITASGPLAKRPPHIVLDFVVSLIRSLPLPLVALLYAALPIGANPAPAQQIGPDERAALTALLDGDMRKLTVHAAPEPAPDVAFTAADGTETTLAAGNGSIRLVNFWATWCAPCREEMPALDALARDLGGEAFAVLPVATGRNDSDAIARFWEEAGIATLATALDPQSRLAAAMNVLGLPVTIILDRDGREIARMIGGADWNGPSARAVVEYLVALPH
jgi:thiol-disulfide isomerase/thioredoxin